MSEKLEDLLATNERELLSFRSDMQRLKLKFINDTGQFVAKWYEETAKKYVTKYPDVFLNLSPNHIGDLKTKVRHLIAHSIEITDKALSQPGIWWHEKPERQTAVSQYDQLGDQQVGNKYPEVIDAPVRIALGELGIILEEFGLNIRTAVNHGSRDQEYWFQKSEEKSISPYFPHMFEWSKQMQETLQEYNCLYKKALLKLQEIQRIKDEIKRKMIIDLWDSTT
jgi:hypothetical protein